MNYHLSRNKFHSVQLHMRQMVNRRYLSTLLNYEENTILLSFSERSTQPCTTFSKVTVLKPCNNRRGERENGIVNRYSTAICCHYTSILGFCRYELAMSMQVTVIGLPYSAYVSSKAK